MTKVVVYATLAGCAAGLLGCFKADFGSELSKDPVFNVNYQIDSTEYSKVAGEEDTYMFTYSGLTPDGVWQFSGSFAPATCTTHDCPGTLTFHWRNNGFGDDLDSAYIGTDFVTLSHPYFRSGIPTPEFYHLSFGCYSDSMNRFTAAWTVNGDPVGNEEQYFIRDVWDPVPMDVSCTLTHESGFSGKFSQRYSDYSYYDFPFNARMKMEALHDSNAIRLSLFMFTSQTFDYKWSNGATTPSIDIPANPAASYTVTITDPGGNTATIEMRDLVKTPVAALPVSLGPLNGSNFLTNTAKQGGFIIEWTDPQGIHWRSDLGDQYNQGNFFKVTDVQPYQLNENGEFTQLLQVEWKCTLYNEVGESKPMSGSGTIATGWWK